MQTLTIGKAIYTCTPEHAGEIFRLSQNKRKPSKPRVKSERRLYPVFYPGMSTRVYVSLYFDLNCERRVSRSNVHAYDSSAYVNHLALYQPLSDDPAAVPRGEETIEIIED